MDKQIKADILDRLKAIEEEKNIEIIFACESGSRAWGFESTDSDYDVRFIYRHPKEKYLSVFNFRDTVEYPVDDLLDFAGWDLKKGLGFFHSTNAVFYEWLNSPIIYREIPEWRQVLIAEQDRFFNPKKAVHHYLGTARSTWNKHLEKEQVNVKKIFYALRPVLAAKWIVHFNTVPPVDFNELLIPELVDRVLITEIQSLIELKKTLTEGDQLDTLKPILLFIEQSISELGSHDFPQKKNNSQGEADELFLKLLEFGK